MADTEFDTIEANLDALEGEGVPDSWVAGFKQVRGELAKLRTSAKPLREAFDGVPEMDRSVILDFVKTYRQHPEAGAQWAISVARDLAGDRYDEFAGVNPDVKVTETDETDDTEESTDMAAMSPEDYTKMVNEAIAKGISDFKNELKTERETEAAEARARNQIEAKLRELGYDPTSRTAKLLLLEAQQLGGDPLEAISTAFEDMDAQFKPVPASSDPGANAVRNTETSRDAGASETSAPEMGQTESKPTTGAENRTGTISDGHAAAAARIHDLLGAAPGFDD